MNLSNNKTEQEDGFDKTVLRIFAVTVIMLSMFLFLTSCAKTSSEIADEKGGITAAQVIENPSAYVGKTVTVSGDVEEIHGPRAFNMDSGSSVGELLVVGREPFPNLADAGDRAYVINDVATVTGKIELLDAVKLKDEIGWDLDPNLVSQYNGKPVLVVQKASFRAGNGKTATATNGISNPNQSGMDANAGQPMGVTNPNQTMTDNNPNQTSGSNNVGQTMGAANSNQMTGSTNPNQMAGKNNSDQMKAGNKLTDASVYASAADKLSFVGREGQFSNLRVVRVVGPRTFTVASGKGEIYVMLDDESAREVGTQGKIDVGNTLNVSGRFERLNMEEISDVAGNRFRALTDTERAFMKKTPVYFQANQVSKLK